MKDFNVEAFLLPNQTKLRAFTDVGCYPIFYLDEEEDVLCADCADVARTDADLPQIIAAEVNWEDPAMYCACGDRIESAYGE
jgi:hypothetical protein